MYRVDAFEGGSEDEEGLEDKKGLEDEERRGREVKR